MSNENVVATISVPEVLDKDGERNGLSESQMSNDQLRPIIDYMYLRNGSLPDDENSARKLTLDKKNNMFYWMTFFITWLQMAPYM